MRYINLYTEPGIEATACGRVLYVYVYVLHTLPACNVLSGIVPGVACVKHNGAVNLNRPQAVWPLDSRPA